MADLLIDEDTVTVSLSWLEKAAALHGDLQVPRSAITWARHVSDGQAEVRGLRAPGTGIPFVILAGTFRAPGLTTFAVCYGRRPAVVLELVGGPFDRLVVTVENGDEVVAWLR